MVTMGVIMKRVAGGSFSALSHATMNGKDCFIVHLHWTSFNNPFDDDYWVYDNVRDAYRMYSVFIQPNMKYYVNMWSDNKNC